MQALPNHGRNVDQSSAQYQLGPVPLLAPDPSYNHRMEPQARIEADLKTAMKARDKERLSTLRMLLTEVKNERIAAGAEVDEARFVALVRKAIKQRHEAAEKFREGGREESAAKEEREALILDEYLPKQASEEEVLKAIRALIEAEGLSGPAALGKIMKPILAHFGPRADGGTISRLAREELTRREAAS